MEGPSRMAVCLQPVLFLLPSFFRPGASPSFQITLSLSPSYPRGLHSRRSSLAHVNECRFYLEAWPLVTHCSVSYYQAETYQHLSGGSIFILHTQTRETFIPAQDSAFCSAKLTFASGYFMVVAEDSCGPRMADDGCADADLPDCNCDVARQAPPWVASPGHNFLVTWGWQDGGWSFNP